MTTITIQDIGGTHEISAPVRALTRSQRDAQGIEGIDLADATDATPYAPDELRAEMEDAASHTPPRVVYVLDEGQDVLWASRLASDE